MSTSDGDLPRTRFSPQIGAWLHTVLEADEAAIYDEVNNLDNFPDGCRFSVSAPRHRKGQPDVGTGKWSRAQAYPEILAFTLIRLGIERDREGYEAACRAEEAAGWGEEA